MREGWVAVIVVTALAGASVVAGQGAREKEHVYIGVKACAACHKDPSKGGQYQQWASSRHAMAWRTLGTARALEVAFTAGERGNPQTSAGCLKCHLTVVGVRKELLSDGVRPEDGIGCEACHGPGGDYQAMDVMTSREESVRNGMIIPDEKLCRKCHLSQKFHYKSRIRDVDHPDPTLSRPGR